MRRSARDGWLAAAAAEVDWQDAVRSARLLEGRQSPGPEFRPYPAGWWRMVVARATVEVPGVDIEYAP